MISKTAYDALTGTDTAQPTAQGYYTKLTVAEKESALANVVVDETKVNNGDTVTLTFNNPATGKHAPNNIGSDPTDLTGFTEIIGAKQAKDMNLEVEVDNDVLSDAAMNSDTQKLLVLLDGADVTVNYKADKNATADAAALYDMNVKLKDGTIFNFSDIAANADTTSSLSMQHFWFQIHSNHWYRCC